MRRLFLALCLLLFPAALSAANPEQVSYPSGDQTVHALLYLPSGKGPHPAVVVIHEWWGLNDQIKDEATRFASEGYAALAVDLYRGQVATDSGVAHELMRGLPQDRGVRDLLAAVKYLEGRKDIDSKHLGAVGWCMGGGFAAQLAVASPDIKAVAINYGSLPTDREALARIHAAILGNFGGQDHGITPDDVNAFAAALKSLGKSVDVKIYPDAGHAFENPNNKGVYRPDDTKDAEARMSRFFASELKTN